MSDENVGFVNITITKPTMEAALKEARALGAAVAAGSDGLLSSVATDALVAELRERMAVQGSVVRIVPFAENGETTQPEKATRTRKPKADKGPELAPEPAREEPKAIEDGAQADPKEATEATTTAPTGDEWGTEAGEQKSAEQPTMDEVKAALNNYAGKPGVGQAGARKVMQETGGALRLIDIPADKYRALVDALNAAAAAIDANAKTEA